MRRTALGFLLLVACDVRLAPISGPDAPVGQGPPVPGLARRAPVRAVSLDRAPPVFARAPGRAQPSPVARENALPGDSTWPIASQANAREIEGYAGVECAEAGQSIPISVDAQPAGGPFSYSVYRLGWYGGAGARRVASGGPLVASAQPACPRDPVTNRVECAWPPAFTLTVDPSWTSGAYLVKLHRTDLGVERYVPFVVRDHRRADVLFEAATNTWQAYNPWGGESLYQDASGTSPSGMGFAVSYNRPYGDGDGAEHLLWWEQPLISFLERYGFDVTYGTSVDFSRFRGFSAGVGALVIGGGHDEYWAQGERDQVSSAVASGALSLDYFGANGGYWRVRLEASPVDGAPLRTVTCYKDEPSLDPLASSLPTTRFRDPPNPEPENALFGAMYLDWQLFAAPLRIEDPTSWILAGTGLSAGDLLPGLVGYEFDGLVPNGAAPAGLGVVASSPLATAEGTPGESQLVVRGGAGAPVVFDASSIWFTQGLGSDPNVADPRVYRIAWNVLEGSLAYLRPVRTAPDFGADVPPPAVAAPVAQWAGPVATVAGSVAPGHLDGPGRTARLEWPGGVAATPQGRIVVADTGGNRIRLIDIDPKRTVTTIAGDGLPGAIEGPGATAQFRAPLSPVVGLDGTIYLADSDNHAIRQVGPDPAHTVSLTAGTIARGGGFADGPGASAAFNRPTGLAIDALGNLFVADMANCRIREIANDKARTVTTIAGGAPGDADGPGATAQFDYPTGVAVDDQGQVYVLDSFNQKVKVIRTDPARTVVTLAGGVPGQSNPQGYQDGTGAQARFLAEGGILWAPSGVFVADTGNYRIRQLWPGVDAAHTAVTTYAGNGLDGVADGPASQANLVAPMGLCLCPGDVILVTDPSHGTVRSVAP